jgi:predicted O-linked N-acetylglucosamine transferase (SPINDLY family)
VLGRLLARALIASGRRAERGGRWDRARARYRAAAAVSPRYVPAYLNLGAALEAIGNPDAAARAYESALAAEPGDAFASYNLGRLRYADGEFAEAERMLRAAVRAKPDLADAHVALANALDTRGDLRAATACLEAALALQPGLAGAWYNYADLLSKAERLDAAEAALRRVLELDPSAVSAWHLLSNLLRRTGRLQESLDACAAARRLAPARFDLESTQLLTLTLSDVLSADGLFGRHRAFGERLEAAVPARAAPHSMSRDPERRLRVGYVSCDFYRHPVAWFLLPLLEHHDRRRIESICYFTGNTVDEVTDQVRAAADTWREATALTDAALAQAIERDRVDVLVDLTGHSSAQRLGMFALQPAPVQVTWLGYLHSTGLTRIGYRLSDARADPPGASDRRHTEKLVRLPHCLWCFRPPYAAAVAAAAPCLKNGCVTFGSFNHAAKLTATARRLWAQILLRLPQSRLLLVGVPEGRARDDLLRDFAAAGVDAERLTVLPRLSMGEYLQQCGAVDIALDSMPYSGGTTTFDALWMGVPVLTLAGERPASRSAASILGALGLEQWIAATPEEYLQRALAHAADPQGIAALRGSLRARLRESPLMDEAGFARDMEVAYRAMWRAWCARRIT